MNLEEVARRAKVSTATVSRVLNNVAVVRGATRDRVMQAVSDLNYHPNLHARSLAAGKSSTIGVVVSNMENPFFFDIVSEIESNAHAHGYEILEANTNYDPDQLVKSIRLMAGRRVAGLIVIVSEADSSILEELVNSGLPVVFYDVGIALRKVSRIRMNYGKGMEKVAEYLCGLGHDQRIAWIGHHVEFAPLAERRGALVSAFARLAPRAEVRTFVGKDNLEGGWQVARNMLVHDFRPTAVVCANDFMAVGVLRALRELGIRVPGEMSVVGLDNIKLSEFCYPSLTTVDVPRNRIGNMAIEKLLAEIGDDSPGPDEIVIEPELVVRESTGPAAGKG